MTKKAHIPVGKFSVAQVVKEINKHIEGRNVEGIFFNPVSLMKGTIEIHTSDPVVETQYVAKAQGKGTSKYLGVYFNRGKWRAKIVRKQKVLCETFETEIDAAEWYDRMAIKFDGPDAVVNFPNTNTKVAK